jgi:hypothetical protein
MDNQANLIEFQAPRDEEIQGRLIKDGVVICKG